MADVSPGGLPDQSASPPSAPAGQPSPAAGQFSPGAPVGPPHPPAVDSRPADGHAAQPEPGASLGPTPAHDSVGSFPAAAFQQASPPHDATDQTAAFGQAGPSHGATVAVAGFGQASPSQGPADPATAFAQPPVAADPAAVPALPGRRGWRRWLPMAGVIGFLLAGAIGMLLFLGVDIGPAGLAVGLTAAVLPVPLLVASFLWLDRYEPEPIRYLAFCFAWGAAIATAVALAVNTGAALLFARIGLPDALVAVLVAPFIEELMKALAPILLVWRRRSEWSGITDGIVYCGMSALGFAMVENVLYLGKHGYASGVEEYGPATGLVNLFVIFIIRILFTGFAHPLFTAMTGIGLGLSARSGDRRVRWLAPIAGLLLAMILHGTFNLLPTLSQSLSQPLIMLYGYLGFMVPFFFAVVGFAIALRSWEGRLTERILPQYVRAGWFSPPEVAALGSLARRHSARQWARRVAGPTGQKAMRNFQFAATQLALLRDGMNRGLHRTPTDVHRSTSEEHRLLTALQTYRQTFTFRDPQTPRAHWDGLNYQLTFPDGQTRTVSAPADPVVPVPVRLIPAYNPTPYTPAAYGPPAFTPSPYATPGYAQPGYAAPASATSPSYAPPGYAPLSNSAPPGYVPAPNSAPPGYVPAPNSAPPGYAPAPNTAPPGYGPAPNTAAPGYAPAPSYAAPGYAPPPGASSNYTLPASGAPPYSAPPYTSSPYSAPPYTAPSYNAPSYSPPGTATYNTPPGGPPAYAPGYGAPSYTPPSTTQSQPAPGYAPTGYVPPPADVSGYAPPPVHSSAPPFAPPPHPAEPAGQQHPPPAPPPQPPHDPSPPHHP